MAKCSKCKADITFAKTERGNWMPYNTEPDPEGNLFIAGRSNGYPLVKVVDLFTKADAVRYQPHWSTCSDAEFFRGEIMSHEHIRVECINCGKVIRQCKCIGEKAVTYEACEGCLGQPLAPSTLPVKRFRAEKETGGWWYVVEMAVGTGGAKGHAMDLCVIRNAERLESKRLTAQMASEEYRQAKRSYPSEALVKYLKEDRP